MKKLTSTQETLSAAMISRRSLLKASAALGAVGFASPLFVKNAFSSSGELNFMGWAGYDFKASFDAFTAATGIKINFIEQPDQDAMFAAAKLALQTGAGDVVEDGGHVEPHEVVERTRQRPRVGELQLAHAVADLRGVGCGERQRDDEGREHEHIL